MKVDKRERKCQASEAIFNSDLGAEDLTEEEWSRVQKACKERFKILPGNESINQNGFLVRVDMDRICQRLNLYKERDGNR